MLLRLVTGSDTIPPLGFAPTPNIAFSHEEDVEEHERRLARISTCDNRLTVPVIRRYRDFKEVLTNTIIMLQIFTDS